jgi:DNA-binding MarR family transcriptional regulator/ribosomal protein S18 acetylase RimI-like enzyme
MEDLIPVVRSFNRSVTERVGALRDHFLGTARPLGEARLLWEIGDGCELRSLRSRLALDSGYLSRSLRSLEAAGLITVVPKPEDRRIRVARLTRKGARERALLDRRSDALAQSLLEPLNAKQQRTLVDAMASVERLLTASLVEVREVDPLDAGAQHCLRSYFAELEQRSGESLDPATIASAKPEEMRAPQGSMLVAYLRGEPIGCGALKLHGRAPAELKRMWVDPATRGLGLGRRLLVELEARAAGAGAKVARIETSRHLPEAIALYRSAGWVDVPAFNDEPFADHWFQKRLRPN